MYDAITELEGSTVPPAEPAETATYSETAKAVNGTLKYVLVAEMVGTAVGRLVKMAGQDTTLKNAIRDRAYFAWIPSGDTCVYCLMIAAEAVAEGERIRFVGRSCRTYPRQLQLLIRYPARLGYKLRLI